MEGFQIVEIDLFDFLKNERNRWSDFVPVLGFEFGAKVLFLQQEEITECCYSGVLWVVGCHMDWVVQGEIEVDLDDRIHCWFVYHKDWCPYFVGVTLVDYRY